ncbi:MAG TPA: nuclear transport factor 2 family protein [Pyrinomonadaceae bacterium]|nr:nuclear transport factor 2 family protein [Pyrinomonadaceae bacterium]
MKRCPTCQRTYADDTLNFCLEDGSPLTGIGSAGLDETLTLEANEPPPTEVLPPGLAPTVPARKAAGTTRHQARSTQEDFQQVSAPPQTAQRNTTSVVVLTVAATILLLGLGGLGAWLLLKDNGGGNLNGTQAGTNSSRTDNTGGMQSNVNSNTTSGNTTKPTVSPTPDYTPSPTPSPTTQTVDAAAVRAEVSNALNGWRQTMTNPDVDAHMSYYADTLHTYYNASNVNVSRVRANVARAFSSYSVFDVRVTNLRIEVDPSGQKATATFDKTFEFRNDEKTYAGSGLNRFWFEKIGGRWLITGEKDLRTYY